MHKLNTPIHIIHEVWKFKKSHLIVSLVLVIILALETNLNMILSKHIIDSLNGKNMRITFLLITISLLFHFSIILLQAFKNLYDKKVTEEYNIYSQKYLIKLLSHIPVFEKEQPTFTQKFEMWKQYSSKYLETAINYIVICQMILTSMISIGYLMKSFWFLGMLALSISFIKGWLDFRIIQKRILMNSKVSKLVHKQQYIFGLISNRDSQKELAILNIFDYLEAKWVEIKKEIIKLIKFIDLEDLKTNSIGGFISTCATLFILLISSSMVMKGKLTLGDYIAIPLAYSLVENSMMRIFLNCNKVIENHKYIQRFVDETAVYKFESEKKTPFHFADSIVIRNLNFTYPNKPAPALNNINLTILKGEKVVILGDNAAGKSTLIKLLLGLYHAPSNTISYDGVYQEDLDLKSLWLKSSVVFQDFTRYMLTIAENVGVGNIGDISREDKIKRVLDLVGFRTEAFINGIHSELGYFNDESINISGGQWQRIALARALFRESEILVFDEPTSAIDPLSELDFFELLLSMTSDKTLFIISHRISIARKADKIVMMSDGEIKEIGTHSELIQRKGYYYQMWESQRQWYEQHKLEVV
jgi:ATP-binding cassette, subfamily B, bacterial